MRIIARRTLDEFAQANPQAVAALTAWRLRIRHGAWRTMDEMQRAFPKARALNGERMRFEIQGGDFRLIAAFDFGRQIAFVKFVGSHADYDRIDALTVARY